MIKTDAEKTLSVIYEFYTKGVSINTNTINFHLKFKYPRLKNALIYLSDKSLIKFNPVYNMNGDMESFIFLGISPEAIDLIEDAKLFKRRPTKWYSNEKNEQLKEHRK